MPCFIHSDAIQNLTKTTLAYDKEAIELVKTWGLSLSTLMDMFLSLQIFGSVGPNVITNKFENATAFTQTSSRLLVTEVRRRASNQSTETAALAIADFMQVRKTEKNTKDIIRIRILQSSDTK